MERPIEHFKINGSRLVWEGTRPVEPEEPFRVEGDKMKVRAVRINTKYVMMSSRTRENTVCLPKILTQERVSDELRGFL